MSIKDDFSSVRILVIGDLMLDYTRFGEIKRISPEHPVPIVDMKKNVRYSLGGAANVAANMVSLTGSVSLCGLVANDRAGKQLRNLCTKQNIRLFPIRGEGRRTIVKERIVVQRETLHTRLDSEDVFPISPEISQKIPTYLTNDYNAVILSDYDKGIFQEGLPKELIQKDLPKELIQKAKENNIISLVDPKPKNASRFYGADLVCPNLEEAKKIIGEERKIPYQEIGQRLKEKMGCKYALVTCGEDGMFCYNDDGFHHISTVARKVYDVAGAGDTVIATLALSLASGYGIERAMDYANHAAGIVVGKAGTATCSLDELVKSLDAKNL